MLRASGGCFYCSYKSHHPRSSDESSRNCILMFGFKLSELLHYLYVYVHNTTSFKLETSHPSSQRTLFNLAQTPGNLATVWGGPYVNVFAVRNQHLESSIGVVGWHGPEQAFTSKSTAHATSTTSIWHHISWSPCYINLFNLVVSLT